MGIKSAIRRWLEIPTVTVGPEVPKIKFIRGPETKEGVPAGWHSDINHGQTSPIVVGHVADDGVTNHAITSNVLDGAMAIAGAFNGSRPTVHERTTVNKKRRLDREPVVVDPTDINALLGSLKA